MQATERLRSALVIAPGAAFLDRPSCRVTPVGSVRWLARLLRLLEAVEDSGAGQGQT